ncbi:MAG: guanylate kinase [Clostridia bacterium]|nr:guanylate kinase [Clostridia bacterium]
MNKGKLIIVSGPSGTGKGTVLAEVFRRNPNLVYSVSATTRSPRPGEQNGVEYFFITKEAFEEKIKRDEMLEYATYCGNYYGTPADFIENQRCMGKDIVLEIEPCGAMQVMKKCPDAVSIFILPPSLEELEKRLSSRGTEDAEVVAARIAQAHEEIKKADRYGFQVVNDNVETAALQIDQIIRK